MSTEITPAADSTNDDLDATTKDLSGDFIPAEELKNDPRNNDVEPEKKPSSASRSMAYGYQYEDTHTRIFGECPMVPDGHVKEKHSNMTVIEHKGSSTTPDERAVYAKKPDGNPLTGEGYGEETTNSRVKVPPGGYSSGLW